MPDHSISEIGRRAVRNAERPYWSARDTLQCFAVLRYFAFHLLHRKAAAMNVAERVIANLDVVTSQFSKLLSAQVQFGLLRKLALIDSTAPGEFLNKRFPLAQR